MESIGLTVHVEMSDNLAAALSGLDPVAVALPPQAWQTNYAPYVSDNLVSEAQSHPSVSTCAFDCCKSQGHNVLPGGNVHSLVRFFLMPFASVLRFW